ncbi:hypothetical protein [Enterocloster lavalensis]|uniref:hypothetical protein n=1 Tax=Enterocloster lavalensis TaxID=460384 RepID=UPI002665A31F|nr:hypothetical protein [Enterocloster lavalensis]
MRTTNKEKMVFEKSRQLVEQLSEAGLSLGEALETLRQAEKIVREAMYILAQKRLKSALKDALRAAADHKPTGKSPD